MNKKIFTLLVGALMLLGSSFMVNAQRTVPYLPGKSIAAGIDSTLFYDILSAQTVTNLPSSQDDYYHLLGVTGIANPTTGTQGKDFADALLTDPTFVVYLDSFLNGAGKYISRPRIEELAKLDTAYNFKYIESYKFGAMRRALWCVKYGKTVENINIGFSFTNVHDGVKLGATGISNAYRAIEDNNPVYGDTVNYRSGIFGYTDWFFGHSQTEAPKDKPLYMYANTSDSLLVLVLETNAARGYKLVDDPQSARDTTTGGYSITIKRVHVNDLLVNVTSGDVRTTPTPGRPIVENVLLFTLKKINPFTMNADDWNSVQVEFNRDANKSVSFGGTGTNTYINPFVRWNATRDTSFRNVSAVEVNDSLYHYGYMNLYLNRIGTTNYTKTGGTYLYVDTAFANAGISQTLAFNYGNRRDNTYQTRTTFWGSSFRATRDTIGLGGLVAGTKLDSIEPVKGNYMNDLIYSRDSVRFIYAYMKDSIMENQSKFRIVYDPYADSTFINVYQTRVRNSYVNALNQDVTPNWYENSFWVDTTSNYVATGAGWEDIETAGKIVRPSDAWTNNVYGGTQFNATSTIDRSITEAAAEYYNEVVNNLIRVNDVSSRSDSAVVHTNVNNHAMPDSYDYRFNKHGELNPNDFAAVNGSRGYNFHSGMFAAMVTNAGTRQDIVMISTADTVPLFINYANGANWSALGHIYGWSLNHTIPGTGTVTVANGETRYKDSLLYVNIQDFATDSIITITQSYKNGLKGLNTKIELTYGLKCTPPKPEEIIETLATIPNDLYLIRNTLNQYLGIAIWNATDSVTWEYVPEYEDPTQMPSYQWVLIRDKDAKSFTLYNREYPHVKFENVTMPITSVYHATTNKNPIPSRLLIGKATGSSFNNTVLWGNYLTDAIGLNDANTFSFGEDMLSKVDPQISFIGLKKNVKSNYLLGYKYISKDTALLNSYAFKYMNEMGQPYISWNGYNNPKDTLLYVLGQDKYDKLYFEVKQLDEKFLGGGVTALSGKSTGLYKNIYDELRSRSFTNDSVIVERYGYYDVDKVTDLYPLVRQAYRLFLKDYYKWHTTEEGHFVTLGEDDNYVLTKHMIAIRDFVGKYNQTSRLFGIPHFYFRNTYFDVNSKGDDYFALAQRLDTVTIKTTADRDLYVYWDGSNAGYADVLEYLTTTFGPIVAENTIKQLMNKQKSSLFVALVEDHSFILKMNRRADALQRTSTFQLEKDTDPIYRRFHMNEPHEFRNDLKDAPDTLVFHAVNQALAGKRLYENSGDYTRDYVGPGGNAGDLYGGYGGRVYNKMLNGDYAKDSLGHVLSFLGINTSTQYDSTNYSFYVDTAFIRRGTGWVKPQYMLVVDPLRPEEADYCPPGGTQLIPKNPRGYLLGRFLYNTAMYSKQSTDNNFNLVRKVTPTMIKKDFGFDGTNYTYQSGAISNRWERLAFAWAIHKDDKLYVIKGFEPAANPDSPDATFADPQAVFESLAADYGNGSYIDFDLLETLSRKSATSYTEETYFDGLTMSTAKRRYYDFKTIAEHKADGRSSGLHAIIDLADNTHKDWVFSFRYVERGSSDFVIESETTERDVVNGPMIRPGYGGWVKYDNEVPVITRTDSKQSEIMADAFLSQFNVRAASEYYNNGDMKNPVDIAKPAATFNVIGGIGNVTILNAENKTVVITNALGQTIVSTKINSSNASISIPSGFVVVSVDGEEAVKVLVK